MRKVIPHLTLSMLLVFLVLIVLDGYNPAAGYLNSDVAKVFDLILTGICALLAVRVIFDERRQKGGSRQVLASRKEAGKAQNGGIEE